MKNKPRLIFVLASLLLNGCAMGPDFAPPEALLPARAFTADVGGRFTAPPDPNWWANFHDPLLTALEQRVAAQNLDVQTASIRLAESRFERNVTASAQLPSINGDGTYKRELYSKNGILSLLAPLVSGGSTSGPLIFPINEYNTGFDASWEIDLWGHVRRQVESANAQIDQAAERRRDALVSALAELARDYIQLRGAQTQIRIANDNLRISEDVAKLAQERQQKGLQTGLDTENAAAQIESVRAQLPTLQQQESQYINALSLLLDAPPGGLRGELATPKANPVSPARVPVGIPSELARRRPDIRAAEAQLHAATADIGVAVANFYPKVTFNGTAGFDSLHVNNLWQGSSLQYNFGPSVSLPIFDGGRLHGALQLREAQQQEAAIAYHKTVLQAWHDVVNALVAHRTEQQRRARLAAQLDHARNALSIARTRYQQGVSEFLNVLDAERTELQAEQQYATSTTNVSLDLVQLFKALGGGWEETFPEAGQTTMETTAELTAIPVLDIRPNQP